MSLGSSEQNSKHIEIIISVIKSLNVRTIIQGWEKFLSEIILPENIYKTGSLPHAWLFPLAKAAIHHGGFGTTVSALSSGKPALIIPHLIDQFEWANTVHILGAGPKPVPAYRLTGETFKQACIDLLNNNSFATQAEKIGKQIKSEGNGLESALTLINDYFGAVSLL